MAEPEDDPYADIAPVEDTAGETKNKPEDKKDPPAQTVAESAAVKAEANGAEMQAAATENQATAGEAEKKPTNHRLQDIENDPYDDPYDDPYADLVPPELRAMEEASKLYLAKIKAQGASNPYLNALPQGDTEGEAQDNFVEAKEPSEMLMCLVLASAYLGLAKYCWTPLLLAKDWRLLINIEGFFLGVALLSILVGLRPYMTPSSLQLSNRGIKYRGPYWPQRKTVNWSQVSKVYLSPELILVLYHPDPNKRNLWPLIIPSIYLADRERIAKVFIRYSPIQAVILSSPALLSRIAMILLFLAVVIWLLEMLIVS